MNVTNKISSYGFWLLVFFPLLVLGIVLYSLRKLLTLALSGLDWLLFLVWGAAVMAQRD